MKATAKGLTAAILVLSFAGCQTASQARLEDNANNKPAAGKRDYAAVKYLGATTALIAVDHPVRNYVGKGRSNSLDSITDKAMSLGDKNTVIYISLGLSGAANLTGNYHLADTAFLAAESAFLANKASNGLKLLNQKSQSQSSIRPADGKNKYPYPSNHTTTAFAWASVIDSRSESRTMDIMAYSAAGLVSFARVYHDDHWVSDVWVSALIGTAVGATIAELNQTPKNGVFLGPIADENFLGLGLKTVF